MGLQLYRLKIRITHGNLALVANAIDVEADTNTQFADFFDVDENWNTAKSPISMFTISKYIGDNLSFGVGASFNSISKYAI